MFSSSNALPPLPFNHERHLARVASEPTRPQPQGECHYNDSNGQHQRCPCQIYQHNRIAPGNVCDCGHSACYHSPNRTETRLTSDRVMNALVEKVRRLEEIIIKEREQRNTLLTRERMIWEKEVHALREALSPFYRTENNIQRKFTDMEHRLDLMVDEHLRVKERVSSMDETSNMFEHHADLREASTRLKRKASMGPEVNGVMSPDSGYTHSSSASDIASVSVYRTSQPPSPPMHSAGSPRSSGVLHLNPYGETKHDQRQLYVHRLPSPSEEARSSGFLSIDLAQRLRRQTIETSTQRKVSPQPNNIPLTQGPLPSGLPSPPQQKVSSGALAVSELLSYDYSPKQFSPKQFSPTPKKIKYQNANMSGLELLATAASPLGQRA